MKLKKLISLILATATLAGSAMIGISAAEPLPFTDVESGKWYTNAVDTVYKEGIMTGKTDTVFDPTAHITRAEVVTAFSRIACINIDGYGDKLDFTDTKTGKWYSDSVGWAAEYDVVKGRGDGRFSPNDKITRAELASIIVNFLNYMELNLPDNAKIKSFTDAATFANWMKAPIEEVRRTGLMQGVNGGEFNPKGNATRAEIAQVIANLLPSVGRISVIENGKSDYVIVAGPDAADAAERLQYQLEYTTGKTLKITDKSSGKKEILLGNTSINTDGLGKDGYEVKFNGEQVLIDGETADGIYRGAVQFALAAVSGDDARFTAKTADRDEYKLPVGSLKINGNDISKYTVYYPAAASEKTKIGANDIVKYIELACGVKITTSTEAPGPYAIIIEEKAVDVEGQIDNLDNFRVKSEGDSIRITGSAEYGTMNGCYDFLEKCVGCRFLTETVDYIIPAEEIDIKNVDYSETPGFIYRIQYTAILDSADMLNKLRCREPDWTGGTCHTFDSLDGDYSSQFENQPCLSDEKVFETILANVMALLDANPDAKLISVSQNDNIEYCKCDKCMASYKKYIRSNGGIEKGGTAGNMLEFVNRIAAEVEKKYPDVIIHMFAYLYTKTPPVGIKAHKNVMVQLCTDYCCRKHNYLGTCSDNQLIKNAVEGWSEIAEHLYLWDYRTGHDSACPEIMNTKILDDARAFADHGSLGVFSQGGTLTSNDAGFFELRTYLVGKVYWDPYMTEEEYFAHINDFVTGFYGEKAGELILKAQALYETNNKFCNGRGNYTIGFIILEVRDVIDDVMDLMRQAAISTESRQSFIYADRTIIQFWRLKIECDWDKWYGTSDEMDEYLNNECKALQKHYKKYNILPENFEEFPDFETFTAPPNGWGKMIEDMKEAANQ